MTSIAHPALCASVPPSICRSPSQSRTIERNHIVTLMQDVIPVAQLSHAPWAAEFLNLAPKWMANAEASNASLPLLLRQPLSQHERAIPEQSRPFCLMTTAAVATAAPRH